MARSQIGWNFRKTFTSPGTGAVLAADFFWHLLPTVDGLTASAESAFSGAGTVIHSSAAVLVAESTLAGTGTVTYDTTASLVAESSCTGAGTVSGEFAGGALTAASLFDGSGVLFLNPGALESSGQTEIEYVPVTDGDVVALSGESDFIGTGTVVFHLDAVAVSGESLLIGVGELVPESEETRAAIYRARLRARTANRRLQLLALAGDPAAAAAVQSGWQPFIDAQLDRDSPDAGMLPDTRSAAYRAYQERVALAGDPAAAARVRAGWQPFIDAHRQGPTNTDLDEEYETAGTVPDDRI